MPNQNAFKECDKPIRQQIAVVAEFHAHKIRAERISYRTGIDLSLVNKLLSGEYEKRLFQHLVKQSRINRRNQRLKASMKKTGAVRRAIQERIDSED